MAAEVAIKITADGKAVVTAAQQSSQALQDISVQAGKTGASLTAATKSSEGLEAAMQKMGKPGQSGGLPSYVADLDKTTISAKQTAAALRGVPAQFTDIITSLQGGQAPLTVFLQQGGQLKDMFGGAGNAAKALGGYVMGLVNPFTVGAAIVGGLAFAYEKGAQESWAFQNAATMSGNAVGLSASQFGAMTQSLSEMAGTRGKAAETLTEIASTGKLAGSEIKNIAEAAILMEKATGQAVGDTIKEFAKLADEPVKASLALNKQYNYLTAAVYEQIKALDEQGNKLGAAELAEKTYADALKARATTVIDNAGLMERAWRGITGAAKGAWDAMLGVGREASLQDKLAAVGKEIAKAQGPFNASAFGDGNAEAKAKLQANLQLQASLQEMVRLEKRGAEASAERAQVQSAGVAAVDAVTKANDKYASKQGQLNKALEDYRTELAKIKESNPGSELLKADTIAKTEAGIRKAYKETATLKVDENAKLIASVRESVAATKAELALDQKLTPVQKDIATLYEKISSSKKHYTLETLLTVDALMQEALANEGANITREAARKATEDANKERQKSLDTLVKETATLEDQIRKQQDQNAGIGLTKEAVAALTAQRELDKASTLEALAIKELDRNLDYQQYDATMAKVAAMRQLAGEQARGGKLQTAEDEAKKADAAWTKTAGSIENTLTDSLMRSFEKGQSFAKTARDTIVNMFKTMVLRPVVSAIMTPISGAVGSALGLSGAANAATGGGSVLSGLSSLANIGSSIGAGISQAIANVLPGAVSASLGMTSSALMASNVALAGGGASATAAATAAAAAGNGAALGGLGASVSTALAAIPVWGWVALGTAAVAASLMGKKDSRFGSQYDYTAAGGTQIVGGPNAGVDYAGQSQAQNLTLVGINTTLEKLGSALLVTKFSTGFESSEKGKGFAYAGGSLSNGTVFGQGVMGDGYLTNRGSMTVEEAVAKYQTELKQATLQALQSATDIPRSIAASLAGVNIDALANDALDQLIAVIGKQIAEVDALRAAVQTLPFAYLKDMSFDAAAGLIAAADGLDAVAGNGLEALGSALDQYFNLFTSAEEKTAQLTSTTAAAFAAIGVAMPAVNEGTRDWYKAQVELLGGMDLSVQANAKAYVSVLGLATAVDTLVPAATEVAAVVDTVTTSISDTLRSLQGDAANLQIEIMRKSGNAGGADYAQRALDTTGFDAAELSMYDYVAGLRAQIVVLDDAAAAALTLAATNQTWTDRLAVLAGAETERSLALRDTTDESTRALMRQVYAQEDLKTVTDAATQAAAALAATNQTWTDRLAVLTGAETERSIALRDTTDESTRALMRQVYAQEDLKTVTDAATQAAAALAATNQTWTDRLAVLTGAESERSLALRDTTDESTRALMRQVYAQEDLKTASALAAQALDQAAQSAAQAVAAIASERAGLTRQLLQAQGDTAALRAFDLAAIDPVNRALKEQIWALEDATAANQANAAAASQAASASQQLRSAWQSATDTMFDEIRRIRGLVAGEGVTGFAQAQAEFATTTAQARAGDQDAAKLLPALSQALLALAEGNVSTLQELQYIRAQTAGSLEATAGGLGKRYGLSVPAFADGGDHTGGWAMVGEKGPELAYLPPARIYTAADTRSMQGGGSGGSDPEVLATLRQIHARLALIEGHTGKTKDHAEVTAETLNGAVRGKTSFFTRTAA